MKHRVRIKVFYLRYIFITATLLCLALATDLYCNDEIESTPCMYSQVNIDPHQYPEELASSTHSTQSTTLLKELASSSVPDTLCDRYKQILDRYLDYTAQEANLFFEVLDSSVASIYVKLSLLELISKKWVQNFNFEILFTKYVTKKFESFKKNPNFLLKVLETLCLIKPINASTHYTLMRPFVLNSSLFDPELLKDYKSLVLKSTVYLTPTSRDSVIFSDFGKAYLAAYHKETDDCLRVLFIENFASLGLFDEIESVVNDSKISDIFKIAALSSSYHASSLPEGFKHKISISIDHLLDNDRSSLFLKRIAYYAKLRIKAIPSSSLQNPCNRLFY